MITGRRMMTSKEEKQKQKQDLDSILDAALDELEQDSDDDEHNNSSNDNVEVPSGTLKNQPLENNNNDTSSPTNDAVVDSTDNNVTKGVPYSLEYLANNTTTNNKQRTTSEQKNRPKFGPEPPPPSAAPPSTAVDHGLSAEEANLAASLEGMMKQFASGLDSAAGVDFQNANENDLAANMAELEHAEKALEEMFKKMMMEGGACGAVNDGQSKKKKKSSKIKSSDKNGKTSSSSSNNNNNTESNEKTESNNDVDESINRLLDGINQASSSTTPQQQIPPNLDPSQLEHLSEQMMGSIMNDFEQLNTSKDSNDVVDGVMKQLLDKELMYEPMKEVCTRYPKWLAENKERLSNEEYQKYGTQYQYFQRIVRLYETDPGNFDRLMELMQDIQEYGQPPVEIIKELAPELQFDEEGMPMMDPMGGDGGGMPGMMPGMPFPMGGGANNGEQCCIS